MRATIWIAVAWLLVACGGADHPKNHDGEGCDLAAIGLADTQPIPFWKPPDGCTRSGDTPGDAVIHSAEELAGYYSCAAGVDAGIDFATSQLVLEARDLSPAGGTGEMRGDADKVTRLAYFRSPCPGDPMPMPITIEVAYLLPAGDARPIADASCNVGGCP